MVERPEVRSDCGDRGIDSAGAVRGRVRSAAASAAVFALCVALAATLLKRPPPLLLWNASASSPIGLYLVRRGVAPRVGDTVVAWAPADARRLAAERHYLPAGVPLVKPVAAVAGARICADGRTITINGGAAALRQPRDRAGRPMPWWSGCRRLHGGEVFLLSAKVSDAFDGRYFGVTRASEVIGSARLLWPRPAQGSHNG